MQETALSHDHSEGKPCTINVLIAAAFVSGAVLFFGGWMSFWGWVQVAPQLIAVVLFPIRLHGESLY